MGFNVNYIVNDSLNTKESIGGELLNESRVDVFAPNEEHVLVSVGQPVIIDFIDWLPRHETNAKIKINILGAGSNFINELGTGEKSILSPKEILDGMSLFWDIIEYNTSMTPDPVMRFHLKQPLYCPKGVGIVLTNTDNEKTFRNSCQVRGRIMA